MKNFKLKHVGIIAKYHMRFSLRNGSGIVFLLLTLVCVLFIASSFISPVEMVVEEMGGNVSSMQVIEEVNKSGLADQAAGWLLGDEEEGKFLIHDRPGILSCIMVVILMLLPYLVIFGSFNQFSSDIANRGMRFLLLRTERINIYLGRFLGTLLFTLITVVVSLLLLVLYIQLRLGIYDGLSLWLWGLQGGVAFFFVCLPFVAICSWISGCIDSPFASMVLCLLLVGLPALFFKLISFYLKTESLDRFWPTGWKFGMLNSNIGMVCLSGVVFILFSIIFLYIGLRNFQKRDL